jgi:hypothetical protein
MTTVQHTDSAALAEGSQESRLYWRPGGDKFRFLAGILLLLFAPYALVYFGVSAARGWPGGFGDATGLWSWARFLVTHPAVEIYDRAGLHAAQLALGMDPDTSFPFAYPPPFLLVLWPLGHLPLGISAAMLVLVTLAFYLWATAGGKRHSPLWAATLLAPTTVITIVSGQSAFLSSALLVGGLRLTASQPLVAGVLLGSSSYKPQLGLLVPIALVSARQWRTIAAAALTVAMLVAFTSALFGAAIWPTWLAALPGYSQQVAAESSEILHLMPTVLAALVQTGVPLETARIVQLATTVAMGGLVWKSFRAGPSDLAIAALLVAAFLATPYAFVYDMPVVATAVLWVVVERDRSGEGFTTLEMLILLIVAITPITMPSGPAHFPLGTTSLCLFLALILHRLWRVQARARLRVDSTTPIVSA